MTVPTSSPEATAPVARTRPARRPLDELSLPVDAAALEAASAGSPDWLAADRRAAFEAWSTLPGESNLLYTPYIDLRAAQLDGARFVTDGRHGTGYRSRSRTTPTASSRFDRGPGHGVRPVRVRPRPPGRAPPARRRRRVRPRPARRRVHPSPRTTSSASSPVRCGARASCSTSRPASALARPIVVRWAVGSPDRALVTRTLVRSATAPQASIVEELVAFRTAVPAHGRAGQAFFAGTTEVSLGAEAVAPGREPPGARRRRPIAFQHRFATVGEGASLQWALAQLGGRLIRSRVDNRLVGDRSSVEQVEIVFGSDEQLFDLTLVHDPHRPGHDRRPAVEGGAAREVADLPQGPDHDREERRRHRQLPR